MKLVIDGPPLSKKNQYIVKTNHRTGAHFIGNTKKYEDWEAAAAQGLALQFKGYIITDYPIGITAVFYYKDNLRHDIDNSLNGVMDALTKSGIIKDDNVKYVDCVNVQYGGVDKINPRTEIFLDE